MNKIRSALCGAVAAVMAASGTLPAVAAPVMAPSVPQASVDLVQAQSSRTYRRDDRNDRGRFERRGNRAYYNNSRGYRERRPGYRYYNGYWFPPAAFIVGAIIGGALSDGASNRGHSNRHVAWCEDRYRSYRASDNTFQPYNGPRQQCYSPYS